MKPLTHFSLLSLIYGQMNPKLIGSRPMPRKVDF